LDHLGPNSLNRLLEPRSSSIMFPMLHRIAYYHFPQGLAWTLNHMADWSWERFSAMLLTKDAEQKRVIDYNCDASLIKNFYYMLNNRTWRRLIDLDAEARLTNTVLYHLNHTELRSTLDLYSMLDIWSLKSCKHIRQLLKQEKKVNESSPSFASDIDFNSFDDFQCFDLIEESNSTELEKLFTVEYEQLSTSYSFFKRKPNHDEPSQDKSVHHVDEERPQKRMKQ